MNRLPIPPSVWERIRRFLESGGHGRVELDVRAGQVVGCRIIESIRVSDDEGVTALREPSSLTLR